MTRATWTKPRQCVECTVEHLDRDGTVYADAYESCDDYADAVCEFAASRWVWGPIDAASEAALRKWAREDWDRYVAAIADDDEN
jgi:hypothetical protein